MILIMLSCRGDYIILLFSKVDEEKIWWKKLIIRKEVEKKENLYNKLN